MPTISNSVRTRFDRKFILDQSGCWIWHAAIGSRGYGYFGIKKKILLAHRVSWMIHKGEIPEGMHLDHLCGRKGCVNPDHLEPVSQAENNRRTCLRGGSGNSKKTHCPKGHEYNEENTRVYQGRRFCRLCKIEREASCRK